MHEVCFGWVLLCGCVCAAAGVYHAKSHTHGTPVEPRTSLQQWAASHHTGRPDVQITPCIQQGAGPCSPTIYRHLNTSRHAQMAHALAPSTFIKVLIYACCTSSNIVHCLQHTTYTGGALSRIKHGPDYHRERNDVHVKLHTVIRCVKRRLVANFQRTDGDRTLSPRGPRFLPPRSAIGQVYLGKTVHAFWRHTVLRRWGCQRCPSGLVMTSPVRALELPVRTCWHP